MFNNPTVINPITTVCEDLITPTNLTHSSLPEVVLFKYFGILDLTDEIILSPLNGNTSYFYNCEVTM